MNVEEFVRETLSQISNAAVSVEDKQNRQYVSPDIRVHFDIAVATTDEETSNVGGKLQVASLLNIGANEKKQTGLEQYNRVSFDLILRIPSKVF